MSSFFKLLGMFAVVLLPSFALAALDAGKVQVGKTIGTVTIIDGKQQRQPLATGAFFQEGNRVETGANSTAELVFSNGSSLIVTPGTLLELRTFRQVPSADITDPYRNLEKDPSPSVTEIEITRGKVVGEVRKLNALSTYTIKTPAGLVRVKGTLFTVEYRATPDGMGRLLVNCIRGSVETTVFSSNAGAVLVNPGFQITCQVPTTALLNSLANPVAGAVRPALSPAVLAVLGEPIKMILSLIPAEDFAALVKLVQSQSSLPAEVGYTLGTMVDTAPTIAQLNVPGSPLPKGAIVIINGDEVAKAEKETKKAASLPVPPTSTTTGGSSDAVKKLIDNVQRSVESGQVNGTPTG